MKMTPGKKKIKLFYWSEIKFIFKEKENYGDLLSKYLVEKISGRPVKFVHPKKEPWYKLDKKNYLAIGSIIHHATKDSIVWGSGIIDKKQKIANADFRAVRGPRTRELLLNIGFKCPAIYGDPALLLPKFFHPQIDKKYKLGVIPHYHDFHQAKNMFDKDPNILVIDLMTLDVEDVTRQILSCENLISSSLHGIVVSHAYSIPCVWVKFSDKLFGDGTKFADYFESLEIPLYTPPELKNFDLIHNPFNLFINFPSLPCKDKLKVVQQGLMQSCPFNLK